MSCHRQWTVPHPKGVSMFLWEGRASRTFQACRHPGYLQGLLWKRLSSASRSIKPGRERNSPDKSRQSYDLSYFSHARHRWLWSAVAALKVIRRSCQELDFEGYLFALRKIRTQQAFFFTPTNETGKNALSPFALRLTSCEHFTKNTLNLPRAPW